MAGPSLDLPPTPTYRLARARIPLTLLAAPVEAAKSDEEGCALIDLAIEDGRIAALAASPQEPPPPGAQWPPAC